MFNIRLKMCMEYNSPNVTQPTLTERFFNKKKRELRDLR